MIVLKKRIGAVAMVVLCVVALGLIVAINIESAALNKQESVAINIQEFKDKHWEIGNMQNWIMWTRKDNSSYDYDMDTPRDWCVIADTTWNRYPINGVPYESLAIRYVLDWLENIRIYPYLLSGVSRLITEKDVIVTDLFDKDSWSTDTAIQIFNNIKIELSSAKISYEPVPENGYIWGLTPSGKIFETEQGVTGNRNAFKITLSGGKTFWVLMNQGGIVTSQPIN